MSGCAFFTYRDGTKIHPDTNSDIRHVRKEKENEKNDVHDIFWPETFLQMTARNLLSELNFEINI